MALPNRSLWEQELAKRQQQRRQQTLANQAAQWQPGALNYPGTFMGGVAQNSQRSPDPACMNPITVDPMRTWANERMTRLHQQLPLNVLRKIISTTLEEGENAGLQCRIVWRSGSPYLRLPVTDNFPTDEDVARICLECP